MSKILRRDDASYEVFAAYVVEAGLDFEMRSICLYNHVTIRDIYLDARGPTVHAARLEVWWWLTFVLKKSFNETGRLFDRDPTSIAHAVRGLVNQSITMAVPLDSVSHVRDVARAIADRSLNRNRASGAVRAAINNGKKS
jgi:hypothetical protein